MNVIISGFEITEVMTDSYCIRRVMWDKYVSRTGCTHFSARDVILFLAGKLDGAQ